MTPLQSHLGTRNVEAFGNVNPRTSPIMEGGDENEAIETFTSITGADAPTAQHVLEAHGWDLNRGIEFFLESSNAPTTRQTAEDSSLRTHAGATHLSAPTKQAVCHTVHIESCYAHFYARHSLMHTSSCHASMLWYGILFRAH